jgi:hypothetical protein
MNKVFVDLEGVLIDNWHDANSILEYTGEQIVTIVNQYNVGGICHLFSFAVDDERDKERVLRILPEVEKALKIKFESVITVENVIETINWTDFMFMLKQRGKSFGFIDYVRNMLMHISF